MTAASDRRTVLTTGANSGIGLATVIELAKRGFRSVGSVRSPSKAKSVHRAAERSGVDVETVLLDVTERSGCEDVVERLSPLYGLVNNAGYGGIGAVEDIGDDEARDMLETMVVAPARLARLALPAMRERREGRIVNISSVYGRATTPLTGWYQGCKHALEALSDALRAEVASAGVKVILIEPGGFKTAIWDDVERDVERRNSSRYAAAYRRSLQATRLSAPLMGSPEGCARMIARALSSPFPRARYLVGYDAQAFAFVNRVAPTGMKDRVSRIVLGL